MFWYSGFIIFAVTNEGLKRWLWIHLLLSSPVSPPKWRAILHEMVHIFWVDCFWALCLTHNLHGAAYKKFYVSYCKSCLRPAVAVSISAVFFPLHVKQMLSKFLDGTGPHGLDLWRDLLFAQPAPESPRLGVCSQLKATKNQHTYTLYIWQKCVMWFTYIFIYI